MKKIIFFISNLSSGGAERVVSNLSLELPKNIEKKIVLFDRKIDYSYDAKLEVFHPPKNKKILRRFFNFIQKYNEIKKIKINNKDTTVISFLEYPNFLNLLTRKHGEAIISVRNFMSIKHADGLRSFFWNMTIRFLYKKASAIIVVSEAIKKDLINNYKIPAKKIDVIYNSYPIKIIKELSKDKIEKEYEEVFKKPVVITMGSLENQKGQHHLIRAFNEVKKQISDAQLVLIGEGILREELTILANKLNLSKDIHFLGLKKNPFKYISKSKVFVMTSYYEGFPNALVESMICGVPVISTDCLSGPREILAPLETDAKEISFTEKENRYGILTPVCDSDIKNWLDILSNEEKKLASFIIKLLNDHTLWKYFSKESIKRAKDFDMDNLIKEWEKYC